MDRTTDTLGDYSVSAPSWAKPVTAQPPPEYLSPLRCRQGLDEHVISHTFPQLRCCRLFSLCYKTNRSRNIDTESNTPNMRLDLGKYVLSRMYVCVMTIAATEISPWVSMMCSVAHRGTSCPRGGAERDRCLHWSALETSDDSAVKMRKPTPPPTDPVWEAVLQ